MKQLVSAVIEEFEQGAWVADLVSTDAFDGSFTIDDVTWTGTAVNARVDERGLNVTRVIGGTGNLATVLDDKFYDGSVSLQVAVQDVCRDSGETFGGAQPTITLVTYQRLQGPTYTALDALAATQKMVWWIGRDGKMNMQTARPVSALATGVRTDSDQDSVFLIDPKAELGGVYGDDSKTIRHLRWEYTAQQTTVRAYFIPFLFRAPVQLGYSCKYNASVDRDNEDGTIDVIVTGRFGEKRVPLFCGVPGSKVKVNGGEQVTLGYFGGDPQKPYCESSAQSVAATKKVARMSDEVTITVSAADISALTLTCASAPGPVVGVGGTLKGTITAGSARLLVGDA